MILKGFHHRAPVRQSIPATWQAHRKEWLPEPTQTSRRCAATVARHGACGKMDAWDGILILFGKNIINDSCLWMTISSLRIIAMTF